MDGFKSVWPEDPKDAKRVMIEWMVSDEHIRHPIPDQKELEMLALATGLQEKQIKSWIYSNRKRWWEPEVLKRGGEVDGFKSVWPEDPKDAKRVMIEWMVSDEHIRHPIPDQKELEMLALATGLQEKQIKSWIYSNRKRWWEPEVLKRGGEVGGFKSVWPEDSSFGDPLPCLRPLHPFPFRRFCLLLSIFSISLAPISPQALSLRSSTLLLSFPPPPCVPYFHHYHASLSRPSVSSSPTSSRSLPRLFLPLYVFALP